MENLSFANKSIEFIATYFVATALGFKPEENQEEIDGSNEDVMPLTREELLSEQVFNPQSGVNISDMGDLLDIQMGDEYDAILERVTESYDSEQEKLFWFNNGKHPNNPEFREEFLVTNDYMANQQNLEADKLDGWSGTLSYMADNAESAFRDEVESKLGAKAAQNDWDSTGAGFGQDEISNLHGAGFQSAARTWRPQYDRSKLSIEYVQKIGDKRNALRTAWQTVKTEGGDNAHILAYYAVKGKKANDALNLTWKQYWAKFFATKKSAEEKAKAHVGRMKIKRGGKLFLGSYCMEDKKVKDAYDRTYRAVLNGWMSNLQQARIVITLCSYIEDKQDSKSHEIALATIERWKKYKAPKRESHKEFLAEQAEEFWAKIREEEDAIEDNQKLYLY